MNIPYGFHAQPGATIQSSDTDPDVSAANECRDVGNIHYCAGASLSLGYVGESPTNNTGIGLLFVTRRGGEVGLTVALTPKAMRGLATALQDMAGQIDAHAENQASAALARAKGAGK